MKKNEIVNAIIDDLLKECQECSIVDMLEDYLYSGFKGFENCTNEELIQAYLYPLHSDSPRTKLTTIDKESQS